MSIDLAMAQWHIQTAIKLCSDEKELIQTMADICRTVAKESTKWHNDHKEVKDETDN